MNILVTGGTEGIGRGLAMRYLSRGDTVLVTGRTREKLARAEQDGLRTVASDIGDPSARERLAEHVRSVFGTLDVLVNNAGIQRRTSIAADDAPWNERQREIDILLAGPIHLTHLLVSSMNPAGSTIVNVTSGGAFVPQVFAPTYSACKAALHHYTVTLRHALAPTRCRVVELVPPAVQTSLATPSHGADLDAFCDGVFAELTSGANEVIGYGPTKDIDRAARADLDAAFVASAARANVRRYGT